MTTITTSIICLIQTMTGNKIFNNTAHLLSYCFCQVAPRKYPRARNRMHLFANHLYFTFYKVVKMLIAVVTIFATLWLPHRGMLVYNTIASLIGLPRYMDLWFLMFAKTCIYINRSHSCSGHFHFILQPSFQRHKPDVIQPHVDQVSPSLPADPVLPPGLNVRWCT